MSDKEIHSIVGRDELIDFGQYLIGLRGHGGYKFEVEQNERLIEKSLEEVIAIYEAFVSSTLQRFRVCIIHCNYAANTICSTDKTFTRRSA